MSDAVRASRILRFRARSFMAIALTPQPPIAEWLAELDAWIASAAGYFAERPCVLDLSAVRVSRSGIAHLIDELETRGVRVLGIEGTAEGTLGRGLPPVLKGGRTALSDVTVGAAPIAPVATDAPTSLLLDSPVRSGQTVLFPGGDVTVLGNVASGAEIVAGGSIHVYGALRGRAMAGANGNQRARIFCTRIEAELVAIDGCYRTAEELSAELRYRPAQAWLDGEALRLAPLD